MLKAISRLLVRSQDDCKKEIIVGSKSDWKKTAIGLNEQDLMGHVLISGSPGNGVQQMMESMLKQQTENGKGWIYFDTVGDDTFLAEITEVATRCGRQRDLHILAPGGRGTSHCTNIFSDKTAEDSVEILMSLFIDDWLGEIDNKEKDLVRKTLLAIVQAFKSNGALFDVSDISRVLSDTRALADLLENSGNAKAKSALIEFIRLYGNVSHGKIQRFDNSQYFKKSQKICATLFQLQTGDAPRVFNSAIPDFSMDLIIKKGGMCYIKLPFLHEKARTSTQFAKVCMAIINSSVRSLASSGGQVEPGFMIAMPNFQDYEKAAPLINHYASRIGASLVWSSLDTNFIKDSATPVWNASCRILFKGKGNISFETASKLFDVPSQDVCDQINALKPCQFILVKHDAVEAGVMEMKMPGSKEHSGSPMQVAV